MRVIGGSMTPGGTAIFEISYPVTASSVGKQFTILDCAFINDVATLKYIVSFVPSNQSFELRIPSAYPRTPGWRALLQLREDHRQPHGSAGKSAQGWPRLLRDPRPGNDCSAPRGSSRPDRDSIESVESFEPVRSVRADPPAEHGDGRSEPRTVASRYHPRVDRQLAPGFARLLLPARRR